MAAFRQKRRRTAALAPARTCVHAAATRPHRGDAPSFARARFLPGRPRRRWPGPTHGRRPAPLAAVFRDLPLELTAKCVMTRDGPALEARLRQDPQTLVRDPGRAISHAAPRVPRLRAGPVRRPSRAFTLYRGDGLPNAIDATQPMIRAGLLAGIRPRLTSSPRPREGRATTEGRTDNSRYVVTTSTSSFSLPPLLRLGRGLRDVGRREALLITARRRVAADRLQRVFRRRLGHDQLRERVLVVLDDGIAVGAQSQPQRLLLVVRLR